MKKKKKIPLFWSCLTFKPHLKPHPYRVVDLDRLHIFIKGNYKLSRASPARMPVKNHVRLNILHGHNVVFIDNAYNLDAIRISEFPVNP